MGGSCIVTKTTYQGTTCLHEVSAVGRCIIKGMVEAFDNIAKVYAHTTYDEESWFEMCVVPAEQMRRVIEPKALYPREGVNGRGHVVVGQRS